MKPIYFDPEKESISYAEKAVLGSIILDGGYYPLLRSILFADDFADLKHGTVYDSFEHIREENNRINLVSVTEYLSRTGHLEEIGGPVFLVELCENVGTASQAEYYAKRVKEAAIARKYARFNKIAQSEAQQASEGKLPFADVVAKHKAELDKFSDFCVHNAAERINYQDCDPEKTYPVLWPCRIEQFVTLYPKNIAVIAGSSNAGKTAFMLNTAHQNRNQHKIKYFSSEMGPEELRLRLQLFNFPLSDWDCIEFYDRSAKFAPLIDPDAFNIIDYLEITDNFYAIGTEIKEIFDRLRQGIAVIAIQKKSNATYARGGEFTLEKARLYLTIDPGIIKIIKGKNWAQPGISPKDMEFYFKLVNGCRFMEPK